VGFVVDKVALGHVFSEYFGFPCQSPGAGTIGCRRAEWTQLDSALRPTLRFKKNYGVSLLTGLNWLRISVQWRALSVAYIVRTVVFRCFAICGRRVPDSISGPFSEHL
jgi:hypothetical protein